MSTEIELIKQLKTIDESIDRLSSCFSEGFDGVTIHETLEEIKVINNNISEQLQRIADALEEQVKNQLALNSKILQNLNYDK